MTGLPPPFRLLPSRVVAAVLSGMLMACATKAHVPPQVRLRQEGYEQLLKSIKPGMHRQQLYAVLPPMEKPLVTHQAGNTFPFIPEKHRLDRECYVKVMYLPRPPPQSRQNFSPQAKGVKPDSIDELLGVPPSTSSTPVIATVRSSKEFRPQGKALKPDSIDNLLNLPPGPHPAPATVPAKPSKEDPNDVIFNLSGIQTEAPLDPPRTPPLSSSAR